MSGFDPVILPSEYSAGSINSIAYDTRVVALESGVEERSTRYNPWGRRKYTILRGIVRHTDMLKLYEFFMLRQGSLNAFKFWDPFDHATTSTRTTHRVNDTTVGSFDEVLVALGNRMFQCVTRYTDDVKTIVRPITKLGNKDDAFGSPTTGAYSINGNPTAPSAVDAETGIVTFPPGPTITFAEGGFEFFVPVRFADNTDKAFQVAMQSTTETQELPGFDLIEVLEPRSISQDYNYGGAKDWGLIQGDVSTSEINGRVQIFEPEAPGISVFLPPINIVPDGGPIFVFRNDGVLDLDVVSNGSGNLLFTMSPNTVVQIFVATVNDSKQWVFFE